LTPISHHAVNKEKFIVYNHIKKNLDLTQLQQIRHKKGGKMAKIRQVKVVTH
jgi:hypothetical protein